MRFLGSLAAFCVMAVSATETGPTHGKVVACSIFAEPSPSPGYFISHGYQFKIDMVDFNLCTHLLYIHMDSSAGVSTMPWDSMDSFKEKIYGRLNELRQKYPHLKISVGVGQNSDEHFKLAIGRDYRNKFIESALNFTLHYKFDGLHLTWSYDNDQPYLTEKYVTYAAELKNSFQAHNLSVTTTFSRTKLAPSTPHDFLSISKHMDYVVVHSRYMENLIQMGVPPSKIIVQIEFIGRGIIAPDPTHQTIGYYEICELLSTDPIKWTKYWDSEVEAGIARRDNGFADKMDIIVYPNSRKMAKATRNIIRRKLAGVVAFTLNSDDYLGKCGIDKDTYDDFRPVNGVTLNIPKTNATSFPLLRTINDSMAVAIDEIKQELKLIEQKV